MLRLLVGEDRYRAALDLYFERHDGQACTIEDWIAVFAEAAGRDLSQFKRWYEQAGTPKVTLLEHWEDGTLTLTLRQYSAPTPGQPLKEPLLIPVALGLVGPDGAELMPTQVLELDSPEQVFTFTDLPARPVVSALRGFSAPVVLEHAQSSAESTVLLGHDTDPFARFEAGRNLARHILHGMILDGAPPNPDYLNAMRLVLVDDRLDPAFRALVLRLPGEDELAQSLHAAGHTPNPDAIHAARRRALCLLAEALAPDLTRMVDAMATPGAYNPDARDAGRRALRLAAAGLLAHADGGTKARDIFAQADNMTEQFGAWCALLAVGAGSAESLQFHRQWQANRLVMDKWFGAQVAFAQPDLAPAVAEELTRHAGFDWKNPNRFRAVIGSLGAHPAGFHQSSGAGYRLVADWLIRLDTANPQAAARISTVFETWSRYDAERQALIRAELTRILDRPDCSRDMGEMVGRMLG